MLNNQFDLITEIIMAVIKGWWYEYMFVIAKSTWSQTNDETKSECLCDLLWFLSDFNNAVFDNVVGTDNNDEI